MSLIITDHACREHSLEPYQDHRVGESAMAQSCIEVKLGAAWSSSIGCQPNKGLTPIGWSEFCCDCHVQNGWQNRGLV